MTNDPLPFLSINGEIPGLTVAAMALPIVIVVIMVTIGSIKRRRRNAAIAAVVADNGFSFVKEDPSRADLFRGFPFGVGGRRRAYNVVRGTYAGQSFETFAYSYVTEWTDSEGRRHRKTHHFQVTWVPLGAPFPEVRLVPHSMLERSLFGHGQDVNTESSEFNKRWLVKAADERIAHAILSGLMIERLLLDDVAEMVLVFEGAGLFTLTGGESDLHDLLSHVTSLRDVAAEIPQFLLKELAPREGA